MKPQTTTPYRSQADLIRLRLQFYHHPQKSSILHSAVNTVNVLRTRGPLPHAVEATAWLVSAQLSDLNKMEPFLLRCAYSMALVRFVNGMLDPFQQAAHAVALLTIAKSIGLSLSFVDLRHSATHGVLPTLELLRMQTEKALDWLHDHYWQLLPVPCAAPGEEAISQEQSPDMILTLRMFKKLRKQSLDQQVAGKCKACLDLLVAIARDDSQCGRMAELLSTDTFLVRETLKFKTCLKIYSPLLDGVTPTFLLALILSLIHRCSTYSDKVYTGGKLDRAQSWLGHLVPLLLKSDFPIEHSVYGMLDRPDTETLLRGALELLPQSPVRTTVEDAIAGKRKKFSLPPLLDDILASPVESNEASPVESKQASPVESKQASPIKSKQSSPDADAALHANFLGLKRQKRQILFYDQPSWTVSPFGTCP